MLRAVMFPRHPVPSVQSLAKIAVLAAVGIRKPVSVLVQVNRSMPSVFCNGLHWTTELSMISVLAYRACHTSLVVLPVSFFCSSDLWPDGFYRCCFAHSCHTCNRSSCMQVYHALMAPKLLAPSATRLGRISVQDAIGTELH